jgi:hypothetical protein
MTTPEEGTRLAEGIYSYSVDDHPNANEIWRLTRLADDRLHLQALLRTDQRVIYGMDLVMGADGTAEALEARVESQGEWRAALTFAAGAVQGQVRGPQGATPVQVALPPGTLPFPESIAMRFLLGRALDLAPEAEQTFSLCLIPVLEARGQPLVPHNVVARATVLGPETVDLLMAEVPATRVLIEWPDHAPQHGWFDARRFPVQWCWVRHTADGGNTSHEYSLTRYAWHDGTGG